MPTFLLLRHTPHNDSIYGCNHIETTERDDFGNRPVREEPVKECAELAPKHIHHRRPFHRGTSAEDCLPDRFPLVFLYAVRIVSLKNPPEEIQVTVYGCKDESANDAQVCHDVFLSFLCSYWIVLWLDISREIPVIT